MLNFKENTLDVKTYLELRAAVNWIKLKEEQAGLALKHSLYTLGAYLDNKPVGMGRIVGDGVVICYIQDLIIHPDFQNMGIGKQIVERLTKYVKQHQEEGTNIMLGLMCARGREDFYKSLGFISRPTDTLGPGMIQYIFRPERTSFS